MTERAVCDSFAAIFERHVSGVATPAEAAAISSHALGCGRCAAALRSVHEFENRFGPPPEASRPAVTRARPWRARHPFLVAGLALAVTAIAGAAAFRSLESRRMPTRVVRGRGGTLAAVATLLPDGGVRLAWPRAPRTLLYHVRLEGSTGADLARQTPNPWLVLPQGDVAPLGNVQLTVEAESPTGERTTGSTTLTLTGEPTKYGKPEPDDTPNGH